MLPASTFTVNNDSTDSTRRRFHGQRHPKVPGQILIGLTTATRSSTQPSPRLARHLTLVPEREYMGFLGTGTTTSRARRSRRRRGFQLIVSPRMEPTAFAPIPVDDNLPPVCSDDGIRQDRVHARQPQTATRPLVASPCERKATALVEVKGRRRGAMRVPSHRRLRSLQRQVFEAE